MPNRRRRSAFALRALAVLLFASAAATAGGENFRFSADTVNSSNAKGRERTELVGHARVVSDTTIITADRIELFGPDFQFATCTGSITVSDENKGIYLETTSLSYDRKKKLSRSQGPTTMEDKKNKVVIKGNVLENDDTNETTIIQVGVRILKENLAARAEYAFYHRHDALLELSGMPVVYRDDDKYEARRIIINTDTNEITLEGEVSGTLVQKEQKKDASATPDAGGTVQAEPSKGKANGP
jgi:lipopolysaccharide export system protein LptA